MKLKIAPKSTEQLYETPLLHQSSFWSQVKSRQGYSSLAFDIKVRENELNLSESESSSYLVDDVLLLMLPINRDLSIGYVPYGPLLSPEEGVQGQFLEELSEQMKEVLPRNCALIRYDLPWQTPWGAEEKPEPEIQQLRLNWGTCERKLHKSCSDQLPTDTLIVSLLGSEEDILLSMKSKTRYNIRLALRKGVAVRTGGIDDLQIFYELYRQTCQRNNITLHDISYFESMFFAKDETAGFQLLIASLDDVPLSAMFLTYSGNRATYLFGASSSSQRDSMSTYALQWEAMMRAKAFGCATYDMFGVAPDENSASHPMIGLNRFKSGFGGRTLHRMGCWDYPLDDEVSETLYNNELMCLGYHRK